MASLSGEERARLFASLSDRQATALLHDWRFWARPQQLAPARDWATWLILAGRGFGKTRCGAEWVRGRVEGPSPLTAPPEGARRIALVAGTEADARDVMVEGESGILAISPRWCRPRYEPSKRKLTWPNGAIAMLFSASEPDQLRGPQHDAAWCDELAKWPQPQMAWDNLQLGLRLGRRPRQVVTTTPRPDATLKGIIAAPDTVVTRGSTYDNASHLPQAFIDRIARQYGGSRHARQEIHGEIVDEVEGALWTRAMIEAARVRERPELRRVIVGVDPAVTCGEGSAETGIVVAGLGIDGHAYVLADRSCRMPPSGWAQRAVHAFQEFDGDRIVGEVNNGGDLVEAVIRTIDRKVPFTPVTASHGKVTRAEPIAILYEQGRVHHVGGLPELEDQMVEFLPQGSAISPDRVDALVWALAELMRDEIAEPRIRDFR